MEQAPKTEKLDDYLQEVVRALQGSCNLGQVTPERRQACR